MPDQTNPSVNDQAEESSRTLGDFRLLRKLGQGGMAEVWLAEQTSLKRRVALKLLREELMQDEKYVARFQREASAAGGLNHPNIVQVHTVGEEQGQHYIAQEYVKGQTLKQYLRKKGPPDLPVALHIMRQVLLERLAFQRLLLRLRFLVVQWLIPLGRVPGELGRYVVA